MHDLLLTNRATSSLSMSEGLAWEGEALVSTLKPDSRLGELFTGEEEEEDDDGEEDDDAFRSASCLEWSITDECRLRTLCRRANGDSDCDDGDDVGDDDDDSWS